MKKIRIGNDILIRWTITRNGEAEDFAELSSLRVSVLSEVNVVRWGNNGWVIDGAGGIIPLTLGGRTGSFSLTNISSQYLYKDAWLKNAAVFPKYEGVSRNSVEYINGIARFTYNRGTTKLTGNSLTNLEMDCNYCNSISYTNAQFYARNLMMFDKALDVNTIKKIQGYE